MPRSENLLTAKQIQAALKKGEPVKLSDGGGLFFTVSEKNKGVWFVRGRLNGIQKKRVLGHEDMTLAEARALKIDEKRALKAGVDSIAEKKAIWKKTEEEGRTFGMIAQEWLDVEFQYVVPLPGSREAGGFLPRAVCGRRKLYRCVHRGRS